jgi:hypothetical protein
MVIGDWNVIGERRGGTKARKDEGKEEARILLFHFSLYIFHFSLGPIRDNQFRSPDVAWTPKHRLG